MCFIVYTIGWSDLALFRKATRIFATISWATDFQFFNVFISLDSSFLELSNAVFEINLLQKLTKI